MSAWPTLKHWITICIISFCVIGCVISVNHDRRHLKGVTQGELAEQFTVETETKNGVESRRTYHLDYSFKVDGNSYSGKDEQDTEPTAAECTVYYDPTDPEINSLRQNPVIPAVMGFSMALAGIAFLASFWLPISQRRNASEVTAPVPGGVGDAAGEFLTMEHGNYDASSYVIIAFFGQIILMILIGTELGRVLTGGHVPADLISVYVCLIALTYTFGVYWDRWRCITAVASRYTSGCANITILYLPIVVFLYANYRGFLKLGRR